MTIWTKAEVRINCHFLVSLKHERLRQQCVMLFLLADLDPIYEKGEQHVQHGQKVRRNCEEFSEIQSSLSDLQGEIDHNACQWPRLQSHEEEVQQFLTTACFVKNDLRREFELE